jgi:hypothetical protein
MLDQGDDEATSDGVMLGRRSMIPSTTRVGTTAVDSSGLSEVDGERQYFSGLGSGRGAASCSSMSSSLELSSSRRYSSDSSSKS